ncbi:MAG: SDR family oxidoreductase [Spirochaetaceae bacterium]|nr:SDR family oxidoreductase [Spirochaetaceae bacterium]
MEITLEGMVAVVTGGSRGIGAAVSLSLAESGAMVVINHLAMERDIEGFNTVQSKIDKIGGRCISVPGDITDSSFCNDLCRIAVEKFGRLDILVNSAGFAVQAGCLEISDELWKNGIEVNLSAAFYTSRAALKHMEDTGRGRIIYIGSSGSITGGGGSAFYSAAKAGINGLVRNLSKELAPRGITVNAILPALIETDLLRDRHSDPEKRKALVDRVPVGRLGQAEDVANAVIFLASDKAEFISGQLIIVDGGSTYK